MLMLFKNGFHIKLKNLVINLQFAGVKPVLYMVTNYKLKLCDFEESVAQLW